jgi:hypothetical protein
MTAATRNGLIGILDAASVAEIDQAVMDAYLSPYSSHEDYVARATGETVYFAVKATAEYHEHWERQRKPLVIWEAPKLWPQPQPGVTLEYSCECGYSTTQPRDFESHYGQAWHAGYMSSRPQTVSASTVTETAVNRD